ncbi:hypothetical protein JXB41_02965 [Candidatus Woesearchaeota archaeon]|nr:hypothetical protein [Candidatus Woesearchaeota archaeon]
MMLAIMLLATVKAYNMQNYPEGFTLAGTTKTVVVGENAAISDIRAANQIIAGLQAKGDQELIVEPDYVLPDLDKDSLEIVNPFAVGAATWDKNIRTYGRNMIIVGGPCANRIADDLLDNPSDCTEGFKEGEGKIIVFEMGTNDIILVAGLTAEDTLAAARILRRYYNYDLKGEEITVSTDEVVKG